MKVEELIDEFDNTAVVISNNSGIHLFERADVEFIPCELLDANVEAFRYLQKDPIRKVPILEIDI